MVPLFAPFLNFEPHGPGAMKLVAQIDTMGLIR